jgi:hypothetical protein
MRSATVRRLTGVDDPELFAIARASIGAEHGLSPAQATRLRGHTAGELRADALEMRRELGLDPVDERPRDQGGRYAKTGGIYDLNRELRRAAGRG